VITLTTNIGAAIREFREQRNYSQNAFSEKIGISQPTLSDIEAGKNNPSISTLIKIATTFGVSVDTFLGIEKAVI
jgi:transcriptional regulator with XRE-family HTH domain